MEHHAPKLNLRGGRTLTQQSGSNVGAYSEAAEGGDGLSLTVEEGLARRQGQRVIFARDMLDTLRGRELTEVVSKLAAETGLAHRAAAETCQSALNSFQ